MQSILPALRALLFASALLPLLMIGGCGLKGDLVLPKTGDPSSSQQESEDDASEDDLLDTDGTP
ncbi:MAG TPA: lipoprotein [Wenzhouxiangellaceae bacterium]|nr:lipoprotein [Wenzhouxiangellaceae bacterium]HKL52562.1 lipoprotein [Wenzhouxiangellaceae bacterium]